MSGSSPALSMPLTGTRLIEASAGTGKTYTLVLLLLRAMITGRCQPRDLVAVTFTRAAAGELRERTRTALAAAARRAADPGAAIPEQLAGAIDGLIAQALSAGEGGESRPQLARRLRAAELGIDEVWLSTLHGFCQRLLAEFGPQLGVPGIGDEVDAGDDLLLQVCSDVWRELQSLRDGPSAVLMAGLFASPVDLVAALKPILTLAPDALLPVPAGDDVVDAAWRRYGDAWHGAHALADRYEELAGLIAQRAAFDISTNRENGLPDAVLEQLRDELADYFHAGPGTRSLGGRLSRLGSAGLAKLQNPRSIKKGLPCPEHPLANAIQVLVDADREWRTQVQVAMLHRLHRQVRERLAQAALEQGRLRFDDLVGQVAGLLAGPAGPRLQTLASARWRLALIDEFQDTDAEQYVVFDGLFAGRLILVGDPKQAIYRFRGGDVYAYLGATQRADGEHRLDTCHRSEAAVVEAVNLLFDPARIARPFHEEFIAYHRVECAYDANRHGELREVDGAAAAGLWLWPMPGDKSGAWSNKSRAQEAVLDGIGAAVVRLLDPEFGPHRYRPDGAVQPLRPGDIAILCQSNRQCDATAAELRRRGVPVSLAADRETEAAAAEDIRRLLAAWLAPGEVSRLRALALSGLYGLDLARLDGDSEESPLSRAQLLEYAEQLRLVESGDLGRALLLAVRGGAAAARRCPEGAGRVEAWLRLVDRLAAWAGPGVGLNDLYLRYRRWQAGQRREEPLARPVAHLEAVQVMTMHASKGLEFGIVFVPFLWDQRGADPPGEPGARRPVRFHDDLGRLRADLGGEDHEAHQARARNEELAEAMRVAYVALTRARHRLYLPVLVNERSWGDCALARLLPGVGARAADRLEAVLRETAALRPEAVHVETPPLGDPCRMSPPTGDHEIETPMARTLSRSVPDTFRLLSYSRLARGLVDVPQDYEQLPPAMPVDPDVGSQDRDWRPRGAAFGSCFHALMEQLDPAAPDAGVLARIAADHGYGDERERGYLERLWRDTVAVQLPGGTSVAALPASARTIELEFFFPLRNFDARRLGEALAIETRYRRPAERWPATLAAARGYLRGFIDLVYQAGGCYYVLDYKTNDLGTDPAAYGEAALEAVMTGHDYDLQYLIYLVALQRLLRSRLGDDYDYERAIGGAVYLFVRGLAAGGGCHVARPSRQLIDALDEVFYGGTT